jgi:hypothetical protein
MKKKILVTAFLIMSLASFGQQDPADIKHFIEKVQKAYRQVSYLDFRVQYRYANKNQPNHYLDSLAGTMAMDKDRIRFVIDGIETVTTGKYTIRVMNEEKLIYLSKAKQPDMINPVSMLDSLLGHTTGVQNSIMRHNGTTTFSIRFSPGQLYDHISMTMDEKTGYLQKVIYDVQATNLVDEELMDKPSQPGKYLPEGRVEIVFSDYRLGYITDALFDESIYFTKHGAQFAPSEQYKDYQIFVASLNL